jgi:ribosomal protein S18 acetylase RimI-like enzyme
MGGSATPDRDELLAFELALDERVVDEVRTESWGRLFLTPSMPLVWDSSWVGIEQVGLEVDEVIAIADAALGGEGFAHRTVCALDEADGRRLGEAVEAEPGRWPGWEVERTRYMVWRGGKTDESLVREVRLREIEGLRRELIAEEMPPGNDDLEGTIDQLFALNARYAAACDDRWFVAPAEGEPLSACCLYRQGRIGQVEDVGTLVRGRGRGHAKAIVTAAVAAAQAAGDETIFLSADAADWPQLLYAKLGFETVGDLTVLRRRP